MALFLVEGSKLDQSVAHHVRVRGQSCAHLIHRVACNLIPIFLVAVDDFQLAAILMGNGSSHLQILLTGAVPLFVLLRSYLDVEAVRFQSLSGQFVEHHAGVYTP